MREVASSEQCEAPVWDRITYVVFQRAAAPAPCAPDALGEATGPRCVCVDEAGAARMAKVLAALGFTLRDCGPQVVAESSERSVEEARHLLIGAGFQDREFRTLVQYRSRRGRPLP